ncbi:MAG TPA: DegT/DnrJ/EryC1/StrS family aminotransferase [bacterium]|nr:DegT/DnrJ/EryC1/StrS family aminotransferase [bacterium]
MNPLRKKIPRGVIYHSLSQSFRYLFLSLLAPLEEKDRVEDWERTFTGYIGRRHAVAFPFARTAIHAALKTLDLPEGSQVLMPPITIKGILDAVVDLGLVPVYADLDPATACFRREGLEEKLGPQVRVALVTPLFGLVPDLEDLCAFLKGRGLFVIEDFSQCLNGRLSERKVGTFGDLSVYSSSSIKTLDTLGGGMAVTDDDALAAKLRRAQEGLAPPSRGWLVRKAWTNLVRNLATTQPFFSIFTFPFLRLLEWKDPEAALKQTGHRAKGRLKALPDLWFRRYTSLQARIGKERLPWVEAIDRSRVAHVDFLKRHCPGAPFPATTPVSRNVYWQLILPVPDARAAQRALAREGIDSATSSLELISDLPDYPNAAPMPEAERLYHHGLFIPCFPHLTDEDMERIAGAVRSLFKDRS